MTVVIILFGTLTFLAGVIMLIHPKGIFNFLSNYSEKRSLHILAVVVRLILGALLLYQSRNSRFPPAIEIIGWLSIAAAVTFALIGRRNFKRLMTWALSLSKPIYRLSGFVAMGFGAFLVYSFV